MEQMLSYGNIKANLKIVLGLNVISHIFWKIVVGDSVVGRCFWEAVAKQASDTS